MNTCKNTVLHVKFSSVLVLFLFLFCQIAFSQTPLVSPIANQSAFPGDSFCIDAPVVNTGAPGFGPYLQLIVPTGLTFNSSSLFGATISPINAGIFPPSPTNQLLDSIILQPVTGPEGQTLILLQPPIGSVVTGGPALDIEICFTIDVVSPVNVAMNVEITPVYQFGDTATGDNGAIIGLPVSFAVTPILIVFNKTNNTPESERPPGPSWPVTYNLIAQVASANTINNLLISDILPTNFVLDVASVSVIGGIGCSVSTGPVLLVNCASVTGTGGADITITYTGFYADVLDENLCSTDIATNNASLDGMFAGLAISTLTSTNSVQVEHFSIQKSATPSTALVPGMTVTFSLNMQLTDFAVANDLQLADILPDGYTFIPGSEVSSFGAINATVNNNIPSNGATTLNFDVTAVTSDIAAGTALSLTYQASINAAYFNGEPVVASDSLTNSVSSSSSLTAGAMGCTDDSLASVVISPVIIIKEVITIGPYQPGDTVTYRLSLDVPSGDTNNIVFTDFFPLPVFFASSIDVLNFGAGFDVRLNATDTLALAPTSMLIDAATNSLIINWPNINTASPQVLSVDVDVTVTTEPFDDDLSLTNILQVSTENTSPIESTGITPVIIQVRAPELLITKGVLMADQGIINPPATVLPVDGDLVDVDAGDNITFQVTIENIGGAPAHDVTLTDPLLAEFTTCSISAVMDGTGAPLPLGGTLATGLILSNPLAANDGTLGEPYSTDTALITYVCIIDTSVTANLLITNTASVSYASTNGGTIFPVLSDDARVTINEPLINKTIITTTPDVDANGSTVTIGETIQYQVVLSMQEGTTQLSSLTDVLDSGLIFQSFDSINPTAGLTSSHAGGFANVLTDATGIGTATATFPFETITNTNTNNAITETITVIYTVIVSDVGSNSNGGQRNNRARFTYSGDFIQDRAPNVTIREPSLTINKTVSPISADAGDTVTYTVVVSNAGTSPAFDVLINDNLSSAFLNLTVGTVTTTAGVITTGNTGGDTTVLVDVASIAIGNSVTVSFDAILAATTPSGTNLINTAGAAYSSLVGGGRIYTPVTDTATVSVDAAVITKSTLPLSSTEQSAGTSSQGNPGLVDLTIGEQVTFEIVTTLAEGVSPAVIITDTLPNNATGSMNVISASVISVGANLTPTIPAPVANISPANVVGFDFGSVSNAADGMVDSNDQIVIQVTAMVLDAGVNSGLEVLTNNVLVQYNTGLDASGSADIEVVEPRLTINKSSPTTTADAGDTITFTISIANTAAGNSSANAFDVNLSDMIPADYTYVGASLSQSSGPAADAGTLTEIGGVIQASWSQFDLGDTVVISYQVTVDNTVAPEQNITNTATVNWSSLPGASLDERAGMNSENHTVTVTSPGLNKMVFATSESNSATAINGPEDDLLIGEQVTYRFTVTIPEGTSLAATVVDQLPTVSTIMNVVSSQVITIGSQLTVPGIMPGQAGTVTNTDADIYNDNVSWSLGNVFNMPDGINNGNDQIVFEVVAILVDEAANQNGGNDIINTVTYNTGGNSSTATALIDIIEPVINVTKTTVPASITADAGDVLDYRITITHAAGSNADAFNFIVTDVLPTPGTNWLNDVTVVSNCGSIIIDSSAAPTIIFTFPTLSLLSGNCTIDYQVQVDVAVNPNITYQNTVTTTYTSTAVINSETRTDTDMDSTSFITPDPAIVKVSASSSLADTGDNIGNMLVPDLAIGEEIDFTLTIIFPEGTTTNSIVTDTLPLAASGGIMEVVSATVDSLGANLSSSLPGTPVITNTDLDAINDTVTFDFGTVVNTPDGSVTTDDQITLTVTARVLDDAINVNLDTLSNNASFTFGVANMLSDTADIEIVEPNLSLSKAMGPMVDHVVPITLTFSNTGNASAYDIAIEDIFDTTLWDAASIVEVTTPAGFTFALVAGPGINQQTVSFTSDTVMSPPATSIEPAEVLVFTFNATLRSDVTPPSTLLNRATMTEASSLPGVDANERDLSDIITNQSLPIPLLDSDKSVLLVSDVNMSGGASPGEVLEYTITIVNSGDGNASNVLLSDAQDANVTLNIGSVTSTHGVITAGNTVGDVLVDVTIATIPAGATVTVVYRVTINDPLADGVVDLTNQGLISSDETPDLLTDDPVTVPGDDPTVMPVDAAPDLVVLKDDGGISTAPGGIVVYTIGYNNIGTQDATGVIITETVPTGSTFNALNSTGVWGCLPDNNAGSTCTQSVGNVNAGDPVATVDFAVMVDPSPLADGVVQLLNNVSIADDGNNGSDLDNTNNSGSDTTPIVATPDMQLTKSDGGISTIPSGTVVYTLTYTNIGDQDATGVTVSETVPLNSTFDPASSDAGWVCVPDNSATSSCSILIGSVAGNGGSGSVNFVVIVDTPLIAGVTELDNTAGVADDGTNGPDPTPADNTANDMTPISAVPDLLVTKTDNGISVSPGDTIVYDISYDNIGNQNATGAFITEVIPTHTVFNAGASSAGWVCVPDGSSGSVCTFTIGGLNVGAGATIQFAVVIDNPLASGVLGISNVVMINDDGANGADPDPSNNLGGETTPLGSALPDLTIVKDDGGVTAVPGNTIVYAINYSNIGNQNSTGVEITETVPANTVFNPTASTASWSCIPDASAGSSCVFSIATLNGGGSSGSINFAVDVNTPLAAGVDAIVNNISIADDGDNGPDIDPNNNNDNDTTPVTAVPDLAINKVDQSNTTTTGGTIIYDISYQNIGTQDATGVVITEIVPVNTTFSAISSSAGWNCLPDNNAGSTCLFNIGGVTVTSGIQVIQFAVVVDNTIPAGVTTITNSVSIGDDGTNGMDSDPSNNSDPEDTDVEAVPDLLVTKTDNNIPTLPGGLIVYDISYDNIGTQDATGVIITEVVPAHTTYNPASSTTGWSCIPNSGAGSACSITIGSVAVAAAATIQFAVTIDEPLASGVVEISNTVTILDDGSNGMDPDTTNNSDTETTPLGSALPDLTVDKDDGGVTVIAGDMIVYVINYANIGNQTSTGVEITETVPAHTVFNPSASTATWVCIPDNTAGSTCIFSIATLNGSGGNGSINFAVDVNTPLPAGIDTINNSVSIADDGTNGLDIDPGNNAGSDMTPVTALPDLSITKVDQSNNVNVGGTIIYDISYQNIGNQDATGVVITETVPVFTTYSAAASSPGWVCIPNNNAGSSCTFDVGSLTVSSGIQVIEYAVIVDDNIPAGISTIDNIIDITDDGINGIDPDPTNNSDPESTDVGAFPDLSITKTDGGITSGPGQTIVYTLSYANIGDQGATGVMLNETVPANTVYNSAASSVAWVCLPDNSAGSACQYMVGSLAAGDSGSVSFAIDVDDPLAIGINLVVNNVTIGDDGTNGDDADPTNNTDTDDTSLQLEPPVGLKSGEFDSVDPRIIHWTFWWFNPNNDRDLPVFIFDEMPKNNSFAGNASCIADGTSSCTMPVFNAALNRIELTAILGEDQGAPFNSVPADLNNEIIIQFDTRVVGGGAILIENQAMANWDENNDGDPIDDATSGQSPIPTDDPLTMDINDPTRLSTALPIPTLGFWALIVLMLGLLSMYKTVGKKYKF